MKAEGKSRTKVGIKCHIRGLLNSWHLKICGSMKFVAFFEVYSIFNSEKNCGKIDDVLNL